MQTQNQFLDFAEQMMARYQGFNHAFEPVSMVYLEDQEGSETGETAVPQNIVTNLYHIQNIKEENYLYRQNLSFVTQILEKRIYQKLYPSVEQQIEKVVREEMPEAEEKLVKSFSQQLYRLVERGGIRQFEVIRDKILSEYHQTEKTTSRGQEVLFRKIENIWSSSVYANEQHKYVTLIQPETTRYSVHPSVTEREVTVLEHGMELIKEQSQLLVQAEPQKIGNLGLVYEQPMESHVEDIRQIRTEEAVEKLLQKTDVRQIETERLLESIHAESVHTESHQVKTEEIQKKELDTVSLTYLEETRPEEIQPGEQAVRSGEVSAKPSEEQTEVRTYKTENVIQTEQITPIQQIKPLETHVEDIRQIRTEEAVEKLLRKTDVRQIETERLLESIHAESVHTESHQVKTEEIQKRELDAVSLTYLKETLFGEQAIQPGEVSAKPSEQPSEVRTYTTEKTTRTEQITPIQTEETVRHGEVVQREEITQKRHLIQQVQPLETHVEDIRQVKTEEAVEKLLQKTDVRQTETEKLLERLQTEHRQTESQQVKVEQIQKKELDTVSLTYLEETRSEEIQPGEQAVRLGEVSAKPSEEQTEVRTYKTEDVIRTEQITPIQQAQPIETPVEDIRQVRTEEAVEKLLQKTDIRQTETKKLLESLHTENIHTERYQLESEQIQKKELETVSLTYLEETHPEERSGELSEEQTEVRTRTTEETTRAEQLTPIQQVKPLESHVEDIRQVRTEEAVEKLLQKTDLRQIETEKLLESLHTENIHTERHQQESEQIQKKELETVSLTYLEETHPGETTRTEQITPIQTEETVRHDEVVQREEITQQRKLIQQVQPLESHVEDIRQVRTEEAVEKLLQKTDLRQLETERLLESLHSQNIHTERHQTESEQIQKKELETVSLTYLEETHPGETTRTEQITPIQTEETVRHGEVVQREEITQQRKLIQQVQPLESHVEDIRQVRTEEAVEKLLQKTDVRQTETERLLERLQTESHQVKTEQIQKKELDAVSLTYLEETLSGEQAARPGEVSAEPSKEQTEVRTYKTEDVIRTEQITSIQQAQPIETHVEDIRQIRTEEAVQKLLQRTDILQTQTEQVQKREQDTVLLTYLEEHQDEISEEHQETIRQVQRNRQIWSIESLVPMQTNAQRMLQNINLHQIRTIKSSHHVQSVPMIEPAAIVYRSEEDLSLEQQEKTERLEHKVDEVVKNLRTVEEKTIVHKEEIIEQQKTVVREVLKNSPAVWTEGEGASQLRKEIQQSMEEQIVQNVDQLVNKVYRRLEDRLRTERGRRGLI